MEASHHGPHKGRVSARLEAAVSRMLDGNEGGSPQKAVAIGLWGDRHGSPTLHTEHRFMYLQIPVAAKGSSPLTGHSRPARQRHAGADVLAFFKQIDRPVRRDLDIHLVFDNLSAHKADGVRE
jgi:hypothetical protein